MQKCYNCGKEVEDNVLICPECGALVKRYGKPEPEQQPQEAAFDAQPQKTAFDVQPQPHDALWRQENGKLKFRGYLTFWLVLCAIYLGYTLLGFACTAFIYRFRDVYFEILGQFEEFAAMAELLQTLLASLAAAPGYYIAVGVLVAAQFVCVIWFLASKRKLAFYLLSVFAVLLTALQLVFGGGLGAIVYLIGPATAALLLRKSWGLLR